MSQTIHAYFIFLFVFPAVKSDLKGDVRNSVRVLQERSKRLYGEHEKRESFKQWELDVDNRLSYPNGDKEKLAEIAHLWSQYYACTSRLVDSMTATGHLPSVSVAAYEDNVATVPCGLCVAPGEASLVTWLYAESKDNLTFTPLEEKDTMIVNIHLTIYNVKTQDAGVYLCRLGHSKSGLVVLEVADDEKYDMINLSESNDRYPAPPLSVTTNLIVFTAWSVWSECSRCDLTGERRRNGMCYVRIIGETKTATKDNSSVIWNEATVKLFQEFPGGIYCKSQLLPLSIRNIPAIDKINNQIATDFCKVPCKQIFEVRSKSGKLIENANNTAGIYSLHQASPPQPVAPGRDVIFAEYGQRLTIKCPGTTLRDIPITWRIGAREVDTTSLERGSGGRIRIDGRNRIELSSVQNNDSNVYSCWQSSHLAGVVMLGVWREERAVGGRPVAIVSMVLAIIALRVVTRLLRYKRRHLH